MQHRIKALAGYVESRTSEPLGRAICNAPNCGEAWEYRPRRRVLARVRLHIAEYPSHVVSVDWRYISIYRAHA